MTAIQQQDVIDHKHSGSWRSLEKLALRMIADAQHHAGAQFIPQLGGGTRLMLALEHRISDDIDLFIRDPQWIAYLTPRLNDRFEAGLHGYDENAVSLKLKYAEGEIDFIVGMSLLGLAGEKSTDTPLLLEPIAEVLAKKLFYRGWALTPRDLFDWWAIETRMPAAIENKQLAQLLKTKFPEIQRSLEAISLSTAAQSAWNAIKAPNKPEISDIAQWGKEKLNYYASLL